MDSVWNYVYCENEASSSVYTVKVYVNIEYHRGYAVIVLIILHRRSADYSQFHSVVVTFLDALASNFLCVGKP
jgi:hypothetical protein